MHWYQEFYTYIKYGLIILFILSFLHLQSSPKYLSDLNLIIQIIICIFLLHRFNPWKRSKFTAFDKIVVFDTAIYLLLSSLIVKLAAVINKNAKGINRINTLTTFKSVSNELNIEKYNKINTEIKNKKKNDDNITNNQVTK